MTQPTLQNLLATRPIHLVALDLDGTTLTPEKTLAPPTIKAIRDCTKRGIHVVLATARPPRSVRPFYKQLKLTTPTIHYNGALTHDLITATNIAHHPMSPKLVHKIITAARALDPTCAIHLEVLDKWYTDILNPDLIPDTGRTFDPDSIAPLPSFLTPPNALAITKFMIQAAPAAMPPLNDLMQDFLHKVTVAISDDTMLQVMKRGLDKSTALHTLAQNLHIDPANIMAIGDAPNDTGMIQYAGLGIAIGDAWPCVKEAADFIAPLSTDHGVAHTLNALLATSS